MKRDIASPSESGFPPLFKIRSCFLLCVLVMTPTATTHAQGLATGHQPPRFAQATKPAQEVQPASTRSDTRYRIGAGDVLDIRVMKNPNLSREAVRVDAQGLIRMPMIDEDIKAACLTESELAREIANRYLKYKRNPQVDVFIKEYNSLPVAIIGAVKAPGRFLLQRPIRLLDLLSYAGGPSDNAGARLQVVHGQQSSICGGPSGNPNDEDHAQPFTYYELTDTLRGLVEANPFVRPGDVISLPEAEQAFIVGNVLRPMAIPLKEPITISRAIAMAGGLMPDTKSDKIRLLRQPSGAVARSEIIVDLKAIDKHMAEDIRLQTGDVLDVPTSAGKRFLRSLVGVIAPAVSQLPVRVVP